MQKKVLKVVKLEKNLEIPEYALETDVGLDIRANENVSLSPFEPVAIKTGIMIEIPAGCVGLIRDRAGVLSEMNVHTSAGTFDSAFRGEVSVFLTNFGEEKVEIEKGMRIAQMIILPVIKVKVQEVKTLSKTERGKRTLGSTGIKKLISELDELEKLAKR